MHCFSAQERKQSHTPKPHSEIESGLHLGNVHEMPSLQHACRIPHHIAYYASEKFSYQTVHQKEMLRSCTCGLTDTANSKGSLPYAAPRN